MKILVCTGIYPPDIGGPATYSQLIKKELPKHGHYVEVLSYSDLGVKNNELGVNYVKRYSVTFLRYLEYFLRVLDIGRGFDIIYVMDPVSVGFPTALANFILRKKLVLKIVGDYAWEQAMQDKTTNIPLLDNFYPFDEVRYGKKIKWFKKIQTWVAKRADKIITPSFYLKGILTGGWGINEKEIKVIYNSFNILSINNQQSTINNSFKILSVGRLVPWKGFVELSEIINQIEGVELEIIGDGPEYNNIKVSDKVKLLGRLSQSQVVQHMCSADLFILNTSYEGLSHVVLEAMACGLPVLISTAGGNKELVGDNEERGYLFKYNDKKIIKEKIEYIKNHPEEAKEKAKKAREYVSSFGKDKMINDLEDLFKSLN